MKYLVDLSLFRRNKQFALIFTGQFVSLLGNMITMVTLPFQVYSLTKSTLMVGLLSLCQLIPLVFTALIGGVFADRHNRRGMLIKAETLLMLSLLFLAWNAYQFQSLLLIFIVSPLMAAITGFHRPALESIIQQVVAKKDMPTVSTVGTFKFSIGMIVGPAIGGLIISHFGVVLTYLVDSITFLVSIIAIYFVNKLPDPEFMKNETPLLALKSGVRYAASRQDLVGSYLVDFIAMIFGMPNALFPAIADKFGGPKYLGMLYSAISVGALLVSFFGGWSRYIYHGRAIAYAAMLWGLAIIGFGFSSNFYWALFFLALSGMLDAISGIYRGILWNQTIPNNYRGRLAGIEMISYLSGPRLGDTEAGLVAALLGVTFSIVSGGVLCVVGVAAVAYSLPKFWNYQAKEEVELVK